VVLEEDWSSVGGTAGVRLSGLEAEWGQRSRLLVVLRRAAVAAVGFVGSPVALRSGSILTPLPYQSDL
jgi:hypothetical protein